jgi:predicted 2-oxoglutarate/Fe(II)-dependent dioxygenase YbiX
MPMDSGSNQPTFNFPQHVLCEPDVLSKEECEALVRTYDMHAELSSQTDYCGNQVLHYWDLESLPAEQRRLNIAVDAISAKLPWSCLSARTYVESLFLNMLPRGGHHPEHADNENKDGGDWKPNHTPRRHYSTLLYLNSDFDGGELFFPDLHIRIRPTRGLLIGFPSHHGFVHTVEPVTEGKRYSIACWFTTDCELALPLSPSSRAAS